MEIPAPGRLSLDPSQQMFSLPVLPEVTSRSPAPSISEVADASLRSLQSQAEAAYRDKNYAMAEVLFTRLAEASPSNPLVFSNLAAVQLELGKLVLAKSNIAKALEIDPRDAFAQTTLGMILIRLGENQAAIDALLQAVELDPASADAFNYLGVAFDQKGNRARAMEEMEKAVKISPHYAEAHFNLAVLGSQGNSTERDTAKAHYEKALALGADPDRSLEKLLH